MEKRATGEGEGRRKVGALARRLDSRCSLVVISVIGVCEQRPPDQSTPLVEHVAHPRQRHDAGEGGAEPAAPDGVPVPAARKEAAGAAGYCVGEAQDCGLRSWVLLPGVKPRAWQA